MPDEFGNALVALGGTLIGGLLSFAGIWVQSRIERDKFARERVWEARSSAYGNIIAALTRAKRYAAWVDAAYDEDPHRCHVSEHYDGIRDKFWSAKSEASAELEANFLLISAPFLQIYENMDVEIQRASDDDLPPESWFGYRNAVDAAVTALVPVARSEVLGPVRGRKKK